MGQTLRRSKPLGPFILSIDYQFLFFVNQRLVSEWADYFMIFLSSSTLWITVLIFLFYYSWRLRKANILAFCFLVVLGVALADSLSSFFLKPYFARLRPCKEFSDTIRAIAGCASFFGFPSNHASNAGIVAALGHMKFGRRIGMVFYTLAFLVCLSRIYLGVHYPSDVLAGLAVGSFLGFIVFFSSEKIRKKFSSSTQA